MYFTIFDTKDLTILHNHGFIFLFFSLGHSNLKLFVFFPTVKLLPKLDSLKFNIRLHIFPLSDNINNRWYRERTDRRSYRSLISNSDGGGGGLPMNPCRTFPIFFLETDPCNYACIQDIPLIPFLFSHTFHLQASEQWIKDIPTRLWHHYKQ